MVEQIEQSPRYNIHATGLLQSLEQPSGRIDVGIGSCTQFWIKRVGRMYSDQPTLSINGFIPREEIQLLERHHENPIIGFLSGNEVLDVSLEWQDVERQRRVWIVVN